MKKYSLFFLLLSFLFTVNVQSQLKKPLIQQKQPIVNYKLRGSFKGGMAIVFYKGKCGLINKKGEITVPIQYDYFNNSNSKIKYHDTTNGSVGRDHVGDIINANNKYGLKDSVGNWIIQCKYEDIGYLADGLIAVKLNGKWGFVDMNDNLIIPFKFDDVGSYENGRFFSEGLIGVCNAGKWGFINKVGIVVIPLIYDHVMAKFKEGLSMVKLNNKWGFIDKNGKIIIPIIHSYAWLYE